MKTCITVEAEGKKAGMSSGLKSPWQQIVLYLIYRIHGKDAKKEMAQSKQQSGKISCAALIGLAQVGKAALLQAKEADDAALRASTKVFTCKGEKLKLNLRSKNQATFREDSSMRN